MTDPIESSSSSVSTSNLEQDVSTSLSKTTTDDGENKGKLDGKNK